jgi:ferredoxin-NADP reductase
MSMLRTLHRRGTMPDVVMHYSSQTCVTAALGDCTLDI